MDKLVIQRLEFYGSIGVTAAEREVGQKMTVDVEVGFDLAPAGQSDDLEQTISYAELARTIERVGTTTECLLLEFMAESMARAILEHFPVTEVRLRLLKTPPPLPLAIEAAGVEIVRRREDRID